MYIYIYIYIYIYTYIYIYIYIYASLSLPLSRPPSPSHPCIASVKQPAARCNSNSELIYSSFVRGALYFTQLQLRTKILLNCIYAWIFYSTASTHAHFTQLHLPTSVLLNCIQAFYSTASTHEHVTQVHVHTRRRSTATASPSSPFASASRCVGKGGIALFMNPQT